MKIFDCVTFFEENRLMELRFNILNDYIDYFIVCESKYDHQGRKKKLTSIYINIQSLRKKLFILF